ncbi:type II secretion system secretin GspD [Paraglaciecola sp.]|uniref:type II secretion system secretin GspD n=1 Tax=Paraglaciecola sp. TaxID=1920173 RepID=UPI0030F45BD3
MTRILLLLSICGLTSQLTSCANAPTEKNPSSFFQIANVSTQSISQPSTKSDSQSIEPPIVKQDLESPLLKKQIRPPLIVKGEGSPFQINSANRHIEPDRPGEITLTFVDADVKLVVREVLGETLGFSYTFAPDIQGTITLQSSKPLPKEALFSLLEATLRLNNIALVRAEGIFHVVPLTEAVRRGLAAPTVSNAKHSALGFGVEIVPLRYVSTVDMQKLLEPFAPKDGVLVADEERNILLLAGTRNELDTMKTTIETFDIDLLRNRSFGIFTPQYTNVDTLARELRAIFQETGSGLLNFVKLLPISRLNKLIVISHQPHYIDTVQTWIERLDESAGSEQPQVFIYTVQHGKAEDMAASLNKLFGNSGDYTSETMTDLGGTNAQNTSETQNSQIIFESPSKPTTTNVNRSGSASNLRISADDKTNMLLIYAEPQTLRQIRTALMSLDTAPLQVMIEASIAEVTLTDDLRFGVQWFIESGKSTFALSPNSNGAIASRYPGFSMFYGATDIRASLNALESITHVNVLSSPKLMVLNNQAAMLQIGDQVPIITQSSIGTSNSSAPIVNSVQLHDTGVILKVTPRINNQGLVQLDVHQEVSDVIPTTSSDINSPTIQQRKINTQVSVQDGETIALGGLIRERKSQSDGGIPFLSKIPLLGALFKDTAKNTTRTELIVFITPHVVRDLEQARQATNDLRKQLKGLKLESRETITPPQLEP